MKIFHLCTFILTVASVARSYESVPHKVCRGTSLGLYWHPSRESYGYESIRNNYINCTHVDGNLEIMGLTGPDYDFSFLENIREVSGYVLISNINVPKIALPRLQLIRGRTLFDGRMFDYGHVRELALVVFTTKIYTLEMPSLVDISKGNVGIYNSRNLCYMNSINWDEIMSGEGSNYTYESTEPMRECSSCDKSCEQGCWGDGPENCQRFSRVNCSPSCWHNRCFGPTKRDCCHSTCSAGCTGPKPTDCIACKNFDDNGVCVHECSGVSKYNLLEKVWESNPNGTFAFGDKCLKKCPEYLVNDNGACVKECSPGKKEQNGECVNCDGPCPRICYGGRINSKTIDNYKNCTIIYGSLYIRGSEFDGYTYIHKNWTFETIDEMHPDRLEVFSTVKEITGQLYIHDTEIHHEFRNLSYFRNLEIIHGRAVNLDFASLTISSTSLSSIELPSLKEISHGTVIITDNGKLCDAREDFWKKIMKSTEYEIQISGNECETSPTGCLARTCYGENFERCICDD